jgi:hypothetical protein
MARKVVKHIVSGLADIVLLLVTIIGTFIVLGIDSIHKRPQNVSGQKRKEMSTSAVNGEAVFDGSIARYNIVDPDILEAEN